MLGIVFMVEGFGFRFQGTSVLPGKAFHGGNGNVDVDESIVNFHPGLVGGFQPGAVDHNNEFVIHQNGFPQFYSREIKRLDVVKSLFEKRINTFVQGGII